MNRLHLIAVLAPLLAGCASGPVFREPPYAAEVAGSGSVTTFRGAEKRIIEGVPFVRLVGTHAEMGLQLGALLRDELREAMRSVAKLRQAVRDYLPPIVRPLTSLVFVDPIVRNIEKRLPPQYLEELRAMAEGSGVAYRDLLFMAGGNGTLQFACTSIVARAGSSIMHGRNLDWAPGWQGDSPVVIDWNPSSGNRYVTVGVMLYPMACLSGVSERGLSLALNIVSYDRNKRSLCEPVYMLMRDLLERGSSMADIDAAFAGYRTDVGWLVTAASADEARGAVWELATDRSVKRALDADGAVVALNCYADPLLEKLLTPALRTGNMANDPRNRIIDAELGTRVPSDEDSMIDALGSVTFLGDSPLDRTGLLCAASTVQSVVMNGAERKVTFASTTGYAAWSRYLEYDLASERVTVKRDALPVFDEPLRSTLAWYGNWFLDLYSGKGKALAARVLADPGMSAIHVEVLAAVRELDPSDLALDDLVAAADAVRERMDDPTRCLIYEGEALLEARSYTAAIEAFASALGSGKATPAQEVTCQAAIAEAYRRSGNKPEASSWATQALAGLDRLEERYLAGQEERELRARLSRYR